MFYGCGRITGRAMTAVGLVDLNLKPPGKADQLELVMPLRVDPVKAFCGPTIVTPTTFVCPGCNSPACMAAMESVESSV